MPSLNTAVFHLANEFTYVFVHDTSFPVLQVNYKGETLHRYIYTLPQNGFHMEVFIRHSADNTPDLIHTFTLDPIGLTPLVAEVKEPAAGIPTKVTITKKAHTTLPSYSFDAFYN